MPKHTLTAGVMLALCLTGCNQSKPTTAAKTAPAKIEHPDEGDIYRIVLTEKAEERLQISTAAVARQAVAQHRTLGGEIVIPDGASLVVTAPFTGSLLQPADGQGPVAGQRIAAGQTVFNLLPMLSPEREVPTAAERVSMANATASLVSSQIIAEGDMKQAQAQVEAAEIALARTRQLFQDKVGSARDVDDAIARLDIAQRGLDAASERKKLLDKLTLEAKSGRVVPIGVAAPQSGMLRMVSSSIGQVVNAGSPLFEIVSLDTLWVRVPVYPGLQHELSTDADSVVRPLGEPDVTVPASFVAAPPTADPVAATVDLYFSIHDSSGRFHPGERVEVSLLLNGDAEALVVPRAAILRDIHGVAWVYVNSAEHEFRRHRVEVHFTTDELAVLNAGPPVGTAVVVDGAAELFGTEFGAGK